MTVLLDARSVKALQIAAGARRWMRLPDGRFSIPSQHNPGQLYAASPQSCQCEDDKRNPERPCKHRIAVSLVLALTEPQPAAASTGLVATRVSDDEIVWDRPHRAPAKPMTEPEAARIMGRL